MAHEPIELPPFERGFYRHYKGGYYLALQLALEEASMQPVVVYYSLASGNTFTRPLTNWFEKIRVNDVECTRFTYQGGGGEIRLDLAKYITVEEKRLMTNHELLHTLWTKAVGMPQYNKSEWKELECRLAVSPAQ